MNKLNFKTYRVYNKVYCIYRSSKGCKDLVAIFFNYAKAYEQKMIWQSEARQGVNYRIYEVETGDEIKYEI